MCKYPEANFTIELSSSRLTNVIGELSDRLANEYTVSEILAEKIIGIRCGVLRSTHHILCGSPFFPDK